MQKALRRIFFFFGTALLLTPGIQASAKPKDSLLILWWNVENLFDPYNDPVTDDDDFTPEGKLQWTAKKLLLKQMRIRHVITAVREHPETGKYPDLLAFAEVENRKVFLETLSPLPGIQYKAVYHDSRDPRGIEIGLAWNPATLVPAGSRAYSVPLEDKPTRKIIVAGFSAAGRPFHVILNHWPSRSFDTAWTEQKRIAAASVCRHIIDSLTVRNPKADVIVMGDFNDEPGNRSVREVLGSSSNAEKVRMSGNKLLYNCWSGYRGIGSYSYKNRWERIDQILVSPGMLDRTGLGLPENGFRCFSFFRMFDITGKKPYPTFEKGRYAGGYSDHLPLLLKAAIE
ncbi:MAG: endonuclease/exonuclease/phosphatase family protein [Chlorobiaceae bacterium]|nr:endonuclease/exonuclease/phosphatase family protein [Chlorobiaceae bacterium]